MLAEIPAFTAQQHQQATIPEPHAAVGQLAHALPQRGQRIPLALIPEARSVEARRHRSASLAHLVTAHQIRHDLTLSDGL
jgi:hypothetical protein